MNLTGIVPVSRYSSSTGVLECFDSSEEKTVLKSCASTASRSLMFFLVSPTQASEFANNDERNSDALNTVNASYRYGPRQRSDSI